MAIDTSRIGVRGPGGYSPQTVLGAGPGRSSGFGALGGSSGGSTFTSGVQGNPPIKKATVGAVDRTAFGTPSREGLDFLRGQTLGFLGDYNNPTETTGFKNLMSLTAERTSRLAGEESRRAGDAAQRRGYGSGAASLAGAQAQRDRMGAVAETGFAGAAQISGQALEGYKAGVGAYAGVLNTHNAAVAQRNQAIFQATTEAQRLQAQLDQDYNGSLIDAAKYTQMQASLDAAYKRALLDAELKREQMEEDTRRWDIDEKQQNDAIRRAEEERQRQYRGRGRDPMSGEGYGPVNPAPGGFDSLGNSNTLIAG